MQNATGTGLPPVAAQPARAAVVSLSLKDRALSELQRIAIVTLYLWMLFALFSYYRRMVLQENGISVWDQTFAIVNALVFAKVILLAQALKLDAGLRKYPLIYTVVGNAFLFAVVLFAFHVTEEGIKALVHGQPFLTAISGFGGGTIGGFLTMAAIMFVCLIPFFGFQEVGLVIGGQALWDLFFSRRESKLRLVKE